MSAVFPARAQDQTTEDKLREALRHATVDLRALQDSQAQLQADRDSATKQRDQLQQQVTDLQQQLAAAQQNAAKKPEAPPPDELKTLHDQLAAAQQQIAALQASNAKWQAAYQQAAEIARQKDSDAKRLGVGLQAAAKENAADHDTNKKLATLAGDILHLYRTHDFRNLLLESYEPLLGLKQVELDNLVQDYEDRIYDLRLFVTKAQRG